MGESIWGNVAPEVKQNLDPSYGYPQEVTLGTGRYSAVSDDTPTKGVNANQSGPRNNSCNFCTIIFVTVALFVVWNLYPKI